MENIAGFITNIFKLVEANIRFHKLSKCQVLIKSSVLGAKLKETLWKTWPA